MGHEASAFATSDERRRHDVVESEGVARPPWNVHDVVCNMDGVDDITGG